MFQVHLESEDRYKELLARANELGINLDTFDPVYQLTATGAVQALRRAIQVKEKELAPAVKDHIEIFRDQHLEELQTAFDLTGRLYTAIHEYNSNNGTKLFLDFLADDFEDIIKKGRAKRGSRIIVRRDLKAFAIAIKDNGYPMQIRIKPSDSEEYITGDITEEGVIKLDKRRYTDIRNAVNAVYKDAVQRGTRQTLTGNPWKSIQVQTPSKQWITADAAYKTVMESDDDEEDDLIALEAST